MSISSTIKALVLFLCISYIFSSCVTSKDTDLVQDIRKGYLVAKDMGEYKIIPGDQLTIIVYSIDEKTRTRFSAYAPQYTAKETNSQTETTSEQLRNKRENVQVIPISVYADGTINFPYIGKIYVQDRTLFEIRELITRKLDNFAPNTGTSADVTLANQFFSVLGESGALRVAMASPKMTIYQALSVATVVGAYGDKSKITILRQTKEGSIVKTFDLRSKEIIDSEYYYIQPNDVIYFPQMKRKILGGTTSLAEVFGLAVSIAGVIVYTLRLF